METVFKFQNEYSEKNEQHKLSKLSKSRLQRPIPVDREIQLDGRVLLSITDPQGVITYCNEAFVDVSGYEEYELAGSQHNIVRHPDMPRVIFKFMWDRLKSKENIIAVVKNMAKTGRYYWVITDFVIKEDSNGNIAGYKAYRKPAPRKAIEAVIPLYEKLRAIEDTKGMEAAENFLIGFFDSKNVIYDDFIESLIISELPQETMGTGKPTTKKEKKSFFKRLFGN